jgi:hypothetical protein
MVESDRSGNKCMSCYGTGETVTNTGPADCPDCGGSGILPTRGVLIEWRARDVERAHGSGDDEAAVHVRWLVSELRSARGALNEIIALAHDLDEDSDRIAQRIRFVANRALGTYEIVSDGAEPVKAGRSS